MSSTTLIPTMPQRCAAAALWRGEALAEFADIAPLRAEAAGLTELHSQLRDDALEARLAAGERAVTAAAAAAAGENPLRERTATLLMRALAMEGRTADAMQAAAAYRRRLAEETGLDPGPAVSALEHEIAAGILAPPPPMRLDRHRSSTRLVRCIASCRGSRTMRSCRHRAS